MLSISKSQLSATSPHMEGLWRVSMENRLARLEEKVDLLLSRMESQADAEQAFGQMVQEASQSIGLVVQEIHRTLDETSACLDQSVSRFDQKEAEHQENLRKLRESHGLQ